MWSFTEGRYAVLQIIHCQILFCGTTKSVEYNWNENSETVKVKFPICETGVLNFDIKILEKY